MRKLRTLLAAVVLTIPMLTLNAGTLTTEVEAGGIQPTHSVTGTCYIYYAGRWWAFPC